MFYEVLFICVILSQKKCFNFQIMFVNLFHVSYSIQNLIIDFIQNFVLLVEEWLNMKEDELCENIQASVFCNKKELLRGICYEGAFIYENHLVLLLKNLQLKIYLFGKY